ncbi:MAG: nucleotidyltransferase family protein [Woeseiaceae bacterium]|nr:nucleotidyltransferase family protein [Woeseiaceae bacterium]
MRVMLLAAGRGERLRPLTDRCPKALVEVAGRTLLERHLARLAAGGVETVVINLGWLGERIVERVGDGRRFGLDVVYSPEYDHVLETGGGILRALPVLGDTPFWVINADIVTDWPVRPPTLADDVDAHLVLVRPPDGSVQGDFDLAKGRVVVGDAPALTFSGIACYRPAFFAGLAPGRFPLAPLLQRAAAAGRVSGELHDGLWADVGTPDRLARATAALQDASR